MQGPILWGISVHTSNQRKLHVITCHSATNNIKTQVLKPSQKPNPTKKSCYISSTSMKIMSSKRSNRTKVTKASQSPTNSTKKITISLARNKLYAKTQKVKTPVVGSKSMEEHSVSAACRTRIDLNQPRLHLKLAIWLSHPFGSWG